MANFRSYSGRSYGYSGLPYRRGYGYGKGYGNGVIRKAKKSIAQSNNSNSSIDFAFKVNYAFAANYDSANETGVAAINIYDVLLNSENFVNMKSMYDLVKVNGVQVRINVTDADLTLSNAGSVKSINIVTGWDKSGLSIQDCNFYSGDDGTSLLTIEDYDSQNATFFENTVGKNVANGYGCKKGLLNSFQRFSRYESCWPTTNNEKSSYIPTSTFNYYISGETATSGKKQISGDYSNQPVNDQIALAIPNTPFETPSLPWKPTLLVGVFKSEVGAQGQITQYGSCDRVLFNAEFTIPCTFKGLKGNR